MKKLLFVSNLIFLAGANMVKVAHRGASGNYPQNTLLAFKKALETNAGMIELDVHLTKDDYLVVFHDFELDKLTNGSGKVCDKTLNQLKQLRVLDSQESIPTLKEVLDLVDNEALIGLKADVSSAEFAIATQPRALPTIHPCDKSPGFLATENKIILDIELKGKNTYKAVANLIKDLVEKNQWHKSNFLVTSFDHEQIREFHKILPDIQIGYIYDSNELPKNLISLKKEGISWLVTDFKDLNSEFAENVHNLGLKILAYTVNNQEDVENLKKLKVDAFATDFPEKSF